jgi:hypothetical protein
MWQRNGGRGIEDREIHAKRIGKITAWAVAK